MRTFHLEVHPPLAGPDDDFASHHRWRRATRDYTTRDVAGDQAFAIYPPIEAPYVRVVCTRNAARARLDEQQYAQMVEELGPGPLLESIVPSSVGFFSVRFE